ncbi:hypothetical protein F2Q70_00017011 [Brassica cretica]|uniref:Uncharacterized protein n=1 Tax=Brassica cretica TaxID=69181 RepID=A0A8S9I0U5_BRACR|nr:hypothetical protein F2Q70_00017011 [Brassica cretica]KAF2598024.1 hypothetical protein F2Q68_00009965 [Brassica cretica]
MISSLILLAKNLIYSLVLGFYGYQGFYGFEHFTKGSKPDLCPLLVVFDLSFKGLRVEHNGNVISDEDHMPI